MADIILAFDSALALWSDPKTPLQLRKCSQSEIEIALAESHHVTTSDLKIALAHPSLQSIAPPVHILTNKLASHCITKRAHRHFWTANTPAGMVLEFDREVPSARLVNGIPIATHVLLSSPELCFAQMARTLDEIELIELGFELCGEYANANCASGMVSRPSRTSPQLLRKELARLSKFKGIKRARRAAQFVLPGARSAKESELAMLATLPPRMDGFAIKPPLLNNPIPIEGKEAQILGQQHIIPDMYWPDEGIVVEYDSDAFHNENTREHDSRKRTVYRMLGITVIDITYGQFKEFETISSILEDLKERITGKKANPPSPQQIARRKALHKKLLFAAKKERAYTPADQGQDETTPG